MGCPLVTQVRGLGQNAEIFQLEELLLTLNMSQAMAIAEIPATVDNASVILRMLALFTATFVIRGELLETRDFRDWLNLIRSATLDPGRIQDLRANRQNLFSLTQAALLVRGNQLMAQAVASLDDRDPLRFPRREDDPAIQNRDRLIAKSNEILDRLSPRWNEWIGTITPKDFVGPEIQELAKVMLNQAGVDDRMSTATAQTLITGKKPSVLKPLLIGALLVGGGLFLFGSR